MLDFITNLFTFQDNKEEIKKIKQDVVHLSQTQSQLPCLYQDKQEFRQNSEQYLDKLSGIEDQKLKTSLEEVKKNEQSAYQSIKMKIEQKFQELKTQQINLKEKPHFYGLDDRVIELDQLYMDYDNNIRYKNQKNLKTITFLISGYTTQESEPSENFEGLANKQNIESQTNLFVFFKWSDTSYLRIIKTVLLDSFNLLRTSNYEQQLQTKLDNWLQQWNCSEIIRKIAYWIIKILILGIKLYAITTSLFSFFVRFVIDIIDSIIKDFKLGYQQSKQGGAVLAQYLQSLNMNLMNNLNIDFMGHSLGTVVIAYALSNLITPARYVILMGGIATTKEIENTKHNYQMCYNFYSTNDSIIQILVEKINLLGDIKFIGTNPLCYRENIFSEETRNGHSVYMQECKKYYEKAMIKFEEIIKEKERKENERKENERKEKAKYQIYMILVGIGACILVGHLLYLWFQPSK